MKKILTFLLVPVFVFLTSSVQGKGLQAFLSYSTFFSPADGPYIETYLIVAGNSTKFIKNQNQKFQSTIEVTLIFRKDSIIKDFKKINILSPEIEDTNAIDFNFIDQQRFLLPNGTYNVEIIISDVHSGNAPYKGFETIEINYPEDKVLVSQIQLVSKFKKTEQSNILSKNGYDLYPYCHFYYPDNENKLIYYAEVYNTDKIMGNEEKFLLSCYIEEYENTKLFGELIKVKKETAKNVVVVFSEFDISSLPTGNYNIVVEVRDKLNKQVAISKLYFERDNLKVMAQIKDIEKVVTEHSFVEMYQNKDSLAEYIRCLNPISSETEIIYAKNQLNRNELQAMQKFFLSFWQSRDAENPGGAWAKYMIEVKKVNNEFSTKIKKGYETDRGRIYLDYGVPNSITKSYFEPSAYPYEIWHYYSCKNQKNKKFVFYNPDMVTNDFVLIHSDAIGEIYDYKWQQKIYGRNNVTNDIDSDGVRDHFGRKSNEYFNNPR